MERRDLLKKSVAGLLGLGLVGCGSGRSGASGVSGVRPHPRLVPVRASWERVIRTTVGLRPYRPSGFVLRREQLGQKALIHNYGHGGAGMSLSWGCAHLATELALEGPRRQAAVIGCGVVGLTTTRQLQRRGFDVTIYAESIPPDTTSNMSLASWTPTSGLVDHGRRTPAWDAQFRRAAAISYQQLQLLVGRGYGVSWLDGYFLTESPPGGGDAGEEDGSDDRGPAREPLLPPELDTGSEVLGPGDHPFSTRYALRSPSIRIEPSIYLDALVRDVRRAGAPIVIRTFDDPRDVAELSEPVVVNCTGLGAGELFGDSEIVPLKGQLTHLIPQPEVEYATFGSATPSAGGFVHMQPRSDGIALGGTSEEGNWDLTPNEEARRRIVEAHIDLFSRMRG